MHRRGPEQKKKEKKWKLRRAAQLRPAARRKNQSLPQFWPSSWARRPVCARRPPTQVHSGAGATGTVCAAANRTGPRSRSWTTKHPLSLVPWELDMYYVGICKVCKLSICLLQLESYVLDTKHNMLLMLFCIKSLVLCVLLILLEYELTWNLDLLTISTEGKG